MHPISDFTFTFTLTLRDTPGFPDRALRHYDITLFHPPHIPSPSPPIAYFLANDLFPNKSGPPPFAMCAACCTIRSD